MRGLLKRSGKRTVCGMVSSRNQKPPSWEKARVATALYHKVAWTVRLDLIYDAHDSKPAFYCNDIPPEVSTPRRQCDFIEPGSFVGPSNDFLPFSGVDLMSDGRVAI